MKRNLLGISLLTISGLYFLLAAVIILITLLTGINVLYGIVASIIILIIQFLISPFITDLTMKWFYKVDFNHEFPDYLKKFVEQVCNDNNMKYPRLGFIDDGAPNAFTYGHTKNDARVILTRGIFELLTEEEVKSVVGHELGHATHYDMLFMTVAQLVPLVLYGIYEVCVQNNSNSDNDNNGNTVLIGYIAYILYIISNYIVLYLSRTREYYADSFSIEVTKNPNALANALVKIGYGLTTAVTNEKHSASKPNALGIFDSKTSKSLIVSSYEDGKISKDHIKQAMKWEQWNYWAKLYELNSTHPLISKRLLEISKRSEEFKQDPFITFDLVKEESYMDDFLLELLINFLPMLTFIIGALVVTFMFKNTEKNLVIGYSVVLLLTTLFSYIKFNRVYSRKEFKTTNVRELLGEVKVSHITSIPVTLKGTIIGRGNPGCIFNEDFVIKDDTGIIFLDYNQPMTIINKIFAIFKSKEYFDKEVQINGWYRRSPVPYVELQSMEVDGKKKKIFTYSLKKACYLIVLIAALVGLFIGFTL